MFQVFVFHEMTGYGWYMCCTYRLDQRWYRDTVALCFPYGMQRAFLLFQMDTTSARRFTAKRKAVLINVLSESFCTWFCEKIFCQLCPNFWGVRWWNSGTAGGKSATKAGAGKTPRGHIIKRRIQMKGSHHFTGYCTFTIPVRLCILSKLSM